MELMFTVVFGVLGVFGLVYGIKSRERKEFSYSLSIVKLIGKLAQKISSLKIMYENVEITDLTRTNLVFWNSGNVTINNDDVVQTMPFSIKCRGECKILSAEILETVETTNEFSIDFKQTENSVYISFNYVDQKQGIIIQILHTGESNQLIISGKIKGGKKLRYKPVRSSENKKINYFANYNKLLAKNLIDYVRIALWVIFMVIAGFSLVSLVLFILKGLIDFLGT